MFSLGGGRAAFLGSKNTYLPTFAPPIYPYMVIKIENRKNFLKIFFKNIAKKGIWKIGRQAFFELENADRATAISCAVRAGLKSTNCRLNCPFFSKRIRRTGSTIQNILNRYLVLVDYTKLWIRFLCLCTAQLMKNSDPSLKNTGHICFFKWK